MILHQMVLQGKDGGKISLGEEKRPASIHKFYTQRAAHIHGPCISDKYSHRQPLFPCGMNK